MIYTLTHDPQILQATCTADREGHRKWRLAAPRPKLWGWLDRVLERHGAERRQAEDDRALDRMIPAQLADIGLTPAAIRARKETKRQYDALARTAKWAL